MDALQNEAVSIQLEISKLHAIQKTHAPSSSAWKQASELLRPLFERMGELSKLTCIPFVWDGASCLKRGHIVLLEGETLPYVVMECQDERGNMPVVLVQALNTGMCIAPTERVARKFIKPFMKG